MSLAQVVQYPYILPTVDEGDVNAQRYWIGLGVTILSSMVYRPWSLEGKRIYAIALPATIPAMEVGIIASPKHPLSPVASSFSAYLSMLAKQA